MPATMNRTDLLITSVLGVCRIRDRWVASGNQKISNEFVEAMDDLIDLWDNGDIPGDARPLYDLYPPLKVEWVRFGEYASENRPAPYPSFWNALKTIESVLIAREEDWEPPMLESIEELRELKPEVTWRQICYIYSHKGVGPFMNNHKEPVPAMAQRQHKYNVAVKEADGDSEKLARLLKASGGVDYLSTYPRDENGNLISLAAVARLNAASRIEKRLTQRAAELLGRATNGHAQEEIEEPDYVPKTRAELDAEGEGSGLDSTPDTLGNPEPDGGRVSDDPLAMQLAESEEAALNEQIFSLHDKSPNVDNRSIADTLGIDIKRVKKALQNREKANKG